MGNQKYSSIVIEFSANNGQEFNIIADMEAAVFPADSNWGNYTWTVPDTISDQCIIELHEYSVAGEGELFKSGKFTIRAN